MTISQKNSKIFFFLFYSAADVPSMSMNILILWKNQVGNLPHYKHKRSSVLLTKIALWESVVQVGSVSFCQTCPLQGLLLHEVPAQRL